MQNLLKKAYISPNILFDSLEKNVLATSEHGIEWDKEWEESQN